mgnify:CR=1 FL=1
MLLPRGKDNRECSRQEAVVVVGGLITAVNFFQASSKEVTIYRFTLKFFRN